MKPSLIFQPHLDFNSQSINEIRRKCLKVIEVLNVLKDDFKLLPLDPLFSFTTFKILLKVIFLLAKSHEGKLVLENQDFALLKEVSFDFFSIVSINVVLVFCHALF